MQTPMFVDWLALHEEECWVRDCLMCSFKNLRMRYWETPVIRQALVEALETLTGGLRRSDGRCFTYSQKISSS